MLLMADIYYADAPEGSRWRRVRVKWRTTSHVYIEGGWFDRRSGGWKGQDPLAPAPAWCNVSALEAQITRQKEFDAITRLFTSR